MTNHPSIILLNGVSSCGKTTMANKMRNLNFVEINKDQVIDCIVYDLFVEYAPDIILSAKELNLSDKDIKNIICGRSKEKFIERYDNKKRSLCEKLLVITESFIHDVKKPTIKDIYEAIHHKALEIIKTGKSVVVDAVMLDMERIKTLKEIFFPYPITTVLLYSPLHENLKKCFLRNIKAHKQLEQNFRMPSWIIDQYTKLYSLGKYSTGLKTKEDLEILDNTTKEITSRLMHLAIEHTHHVLQNTYYASNTTYETEMQEMYNVMDRILRALEPNEPILVRSIIYHDFVVFPSKI